MHNTVLTLLGLCLIASAALLGCGNNNDSEITTVRPLDAPATPAATGSSADRFGMQPRAAAPAVKRYSYETPEGWQERPPSSARQADFQVAGDPNAEAYFAVLGGIGGGLTANVNRWRTQMGLPELSEQEIEALPKEKLLGLDAVFVTMDGAFSGMGSEPKENYRLMGLIAIEGNQAYFAKMTGPIPVLEGQQENFLTFAASLEEGVANPHAGLDMGDPHAGLAGTDPHAGIAGMEMGAMTVTAWRWEAPEGWTKAPDRPMRLVTYTSGPANENEVYIAELSGVAGGAEANVNRWQQQMGQPALTAEEIAALPKLTVMGQEAPMVTIHGTFSDSMRGGTFPDYTMFGAVVPAGEMTLFIKMTGPQALMEAEKDNFIAFVQSINRAE
jgi:hypothetical protein